MKKISKKKTISGTFTRVIVSLVIFQSLFFSMLMVAGGTLSQTKKNSCENFNRTMSNRAMTLQNEMRNRWGNLDKYLPQINQNANLLQKKQDGSYENTSDFFLAVEPVLNNIMRNCKVTDCFIFLDDDQGRELHSAIYLRDDDPFLDGKGNSDICLIAGPTQLAGAYSSIEDWWSYRMQVDSENGDYYNVPYEMGKKFSDAENYGYWSEPFCLKENDDQRISYSVPLLNAEGNVYGVAGIGISLTCLYKDLPSSELAVRDSLGYLIGRVNEDSSRFLPVITKGEYQRKMLNLEKPIELEIYNMDYNLYRLTNNTSKDRLYGNLQKLDIYDSSSPYAGQDWYLMGIQEDTRLFALSSQIKQILLLSLLVSSGFGIIYGVGVSRGLTGSIATIARNVIATNPLLGNYLGRTGIAEIDELAEAIEKGNRNLTETTLKISRAIEQVNLPIAFFQYTENLPQVIATANLADIFEWDKKEYEDLCSDHERFYQKLQEIMRHPVNNQEDIYPVENKSDQKKWIKISLVESGEDTCGLLIDVTKEHEETLRLKQERDTDTLTLLYSRKAFRKKVNSLLYQNNLHTAALIMFDLDNFKAVNDKYGHAFGDSYLKDTALYIKEMSAGGCIAGRRSGDEFYAFLYDFESRADIQDTVEHFFQTLQENPVTFPDGVKHPIQISAGLAWAEGNCDYDELVKEADLTMYQNKKQKKERDGRCTN